MEESSREFIRIVNHVRHDWMNELQTLFGYVQLNKYDKLHDCLEKIKAKAQRDSFISNLGVPTLIAFLIYFPMEKRTIKLEVSMTEEINLPNLPIHADNVAAAIRQLVMVFENHAAARGEESAMLSMELELRDNDLLFDFEFHGTFDERSLREKIQHVLLQYAPDLNMERQEYKNDMAAMIIQAPFRMRD